MPNLWATLLLKMLWKFQDNFLQVFKKKIMLVLSEIGLAAGVGEILGPIQDLMVARSGW